MGTGDGLTTFAGAEVVHLDRLTFMWVQLTRFTIDPGLDDREVLASVIASDAYAHDYASPLDASAPVDEPAVHGRWWRASIRPDSFVACLGVEAEAELRAWADEQQWTDPGFRQPPEVQERLDRVWAVLRAGEVYRLVHRGAEQDHAYGFVTGSLGFHEFVVIDRAAGLAHVVVASDD